MAQSRFWATLSRWVVRLTVRVQESGASLNERNIELARALGDYELVQKLERRGVRHAGRLAERRNRLAELLQER